ncbi:hypothetical protein M8C21_023849 [Ambrosia artemisiifolia]|uniref:Transmembrane protein n=1 Tax=Ambrosia artemisiifolia TaxID=4212 RepID=A0AAD5CGU1_AMBAR|nr:hypothetical protein M8C21_023849 [Ambrosia artemisiifolia]
MAPFNIQPLTKVLFLFVLFALLLIPPSSSLKPSIQLVGRRNLLEKNQAQEYSDGIQQSSKKKQVLGRDCWGLGRCLLGLQLGCIII